jgi:hypothetical protein
MLLSKTPGPCPICGAAHTACTATGKREEPIVAGRITPATTLAVQVRTVGVPGTSNHATALPKPERQDTMSPATAPVTIGADRGRRSREVPPT